MSKKKFIKFDENKLRYGLVPPIALKALAEVFTYGAIKYNEENWKLNKDKDRIIDALYRHLEAYREGERNDQESNLQHLSHAMVNITFLLYMDNND